MCGYSERRVYLSICAVASNASLRLRHKAYIGPTRRSSGRSYRRAAEL